MKDSPRRRPEALARPEFSRRRFVEDEYVALRNATRAKFRETTLDELRRDTPAPHVRSDLIKQLQGVAALICPHKLTDGNAQHFGFRPAREALAKDLGSSVP